MTDRPLPQLVKWPFFVADGVLLLVAWWIMAKSPQPFVPWPMFFLIVTVIAGFAFAVWPYVLEYQAALQASDSSNLTQAVTEIAKVQSVADQIRLATSQWQTAHEHSTKAVTAAKEISERMTVEANAFAEFMQKANDSEKGHLRLETEKLRRNEGEWMQIVVRLLDHIFALHQAGVRSAQPNVREQLTLFQNACRDVVRRIGLTPIDAVPDEAFDEQRHQLVDPAATPDPGATVAETLATGYTFQGQLVRRALVRLKGNSNEATPAPADPAPSVQVPPPAALVSPAPTRAPRTPRTPEIRPTPAIAPEAPSEATPPAAPPVDAEIDPPVEGELPLDPAPRVRRPG